MECLARLLRSSRGCLLVFLGLSGLLRRSLDRASALLRRTSTRPSSSFGRRPARCPIGGRQVCPVASGELELGWWGDQSSCIRCSILIGSDGRWVKQSGDPGSDSVLGGQFDSCRLSAGSLALTRHCRRTEMLCDPDVACDLIRSSSRELLDILFFCVLLRMFGPREGSFEHPSRADVAVATPPLYPSQRRQSFHPCTGVCTIRK